MKERLLTMHKQLQTHDWLSELEKLKMLAKQMGFPVTMGTEDRCNFTKKRISLNRNRVPRNQVYALAHELGHIHVRGEYSAEEEFLLRFPGYACAEHTKGNRVSRVEEEVLAWGEARKLLDEHDVPVDEIAFNRIKQACLSTYITP